MLFSEKVQHCITCFKSHVPLSITLLCILQDVVHSIDVVIRRGREMREILSYITISGVCISLAGVGAYFSFMAIGPTSNPGLYVAAVACLICLITTLSSAARRIIEEGETFRFHASLFFCARGKK